LVNRETSRNELGLIPQKDSADETERRCPDTVRPDWFCRGGLSKQLGLESTGTVNVLYATAASWRGA